MSNPRKVVFANAILNMKYHGELREIGEIFWHKADTSLVSSKQGYAELLARVAEQIIADSTGIRKEEPTP